jgi:hypothetical protein
MKNFAHLSDQAANLLPPSSYYSREYETLAAEGMGSLQFQASTPHCRSPGPAESRSLLPIASQTKILPFNAF